MTFKVSIYQCMAYVNYNKRAKSDHYLIVYNFQYVTLNRVSKFQTITDNICHKN